MAPLVAQRRLNISTKAPAAGHLNSSLPYCVWRVPRGGGGGGTCLSGGHEATDTGLAYAPVSQAHGHHHIVQCFALLSCSADQFCTTPGGC